MFLNNLGMFVPFVFFRQGRQIESYLAHSRIRDEIAEELSRLDDKLGNSCSGGSHPLESCLKYNLLCLFFSPLCLGQPSAIEALPIPLMFFQEH